MKFLNKILSQIFITSIILAIYSQVSIAGDWSIITLDPSVFGENSYLPGIALDSQGKPHISYACEQDYPPWVRYAYWNGDNWVVHSLDWWDYFFKQPKIKLDSQDLPYILYSWDEFVLELAHYDGTSWTFETIDPGSSYYVFDFSLALDSNNRPNLSFSSAPDEPYILSLVYACKQGDVWVNQTVDASSNYVGYYNSIAIDSQDHPHISYFEWQNMKLKYAKWNGSEWEISVVDSGIDDPYSTSIAIDQQDNPHISYYQSTELCYASWNGSEWVIQVVDDNIVTRAGYNLSLILDSQDRPHISYYDYGADSIKYAYFNGTNWDLETLDTCGGYNCIALNSLDQPWIVYEQYVDPERHLKLAWQGDGGGLSISLLSFTATPHEDSSVLLNWSVETTGGEQIAGFNLYRREIVTESYSFPPQKKDEGWTQVNPSLITGQNPYTYTDGNVQGGVTYEYKLEAVLADESTEILGTASCAPEPPAFAITKVYPNPASDVLNIALTLPQSGGVTLELYDLSGRVVFSKDIQVFSPGEFTDQLDVRELSNGVYTLRATQASLSASERVVVVR